MELAELRIFKAVAEHGGITRAAAALNRVQSNVTTRVKQLEERLGARLFHRQGRRLVLSSEGRVLLDYADRLLRLSAEAQAALKGHAPQGVLKIGALESTAATRLPAVLARYHRDYPAVRLELATATTGALVDKVLREELEAAFVAEPFVAGGLQTRHVFTEELVLITARNHPARRRAGRPRQPYRARLPHRLLVPARLEPWLGRAHLVAERVMEYGSYHAIVACAAAGAGIAVVPKSVLRATGMEAQVALHPLPPKIAQAKTMLVWRRGHQSVAARGAAQGARLRIYGVDFTCAPRKAKPITVASGRLRRDLLKVEEIEKLEDFAAFEAFLARPGPWLGGFDFPFSLPRELVRDLGWPADWPGLVAHCARMTRMELRAALDALPQLTPAGKQVRPPRHRPSRGLVQPDEARQSAGGADVPRRRAATRCGRYPSAGVAPSKFFKSRA